MKVNVKKLHPDAVIPKYAKDGDAGLDLTAISTNHQNSFYEYGTGLAFEIPKGYVGLIFPRSSISKKDLTLSNCVGVIDSGYRGEVIFRFQMTSSGRTKITLNHKRFGSGVKPIELEMYEIGDRIGQMIIMPYPSIELEEVSDLSDTVRGDGGFGSSGQ